MNTICPGVVISDVMYDDMDKLDDAGKKQLDAALHRCQPLEPGRMQDIANTALFFAQQYERQHYRPNPAFRRRNKH